MVGPRGLVFQKRLMISIRRLGSFPLCAPPAIRSFARNLPVTPRSKEPGIRWRAVQLGNERIAPSCSRDRGRDSLYRKGDGSQVGGKRRHQRFRLQSDGIRASGREYVWLRQKCHTPSPLSLAGLASGAVRASWWGWLSRWWGWLDGQFCRVKKAFKFLQFVSHAYGFRCDSRLLRVSNSQIDSFNTQVYLLTVCCKFSLNN